jgi:hypothetical protein
MRFVTTGGIPMLRMMGGAPDDEHGHHHQHSHKNAGHMPSADPEHHEP